MSITNPKETVNGTEWEYEPASYVTRLDWFHLAELARKRMTEHSHDVPRWRRERRSFYSCLRAMDVNEVEFFD